MKNKNTTFSNNEWVELRYFTGDIQYGMRTKVPDNFFLSHDQQ